MKNLAIILTAYNRKKQTLASLDAVYQQNDGDFPVNCHVYLTDDGSTDGTAEAIGEQFPQVRLLPGTGELYWNGGMRLAFGEAIKRNYDFYLWLNDDTMLFSDSVQRLLVTSTQFDDKAIIVGSIQDPDTGEWTYGGFVRQHLRRPLRFTPVLPEEIPLPIETMNGNCVLIPAGVGKAVGNLDPAFTHAIGDFDYGLRAKKLGYSVILAPGYYGVCKRNPVNDGNLSLIQRIKRMLSIKGLPPVDWAIFARRYAGPLWPIFWLSPYFHSLFK
jgi:GT2 family glycosyltransferase